jgi:alkylated DNA nucleotide flippase Atl1
MPGAQWPAPGGSARQRPGPADAGEFASRVLDVVDAIPPGMVMSYGDIAEYLGQGGPRQVGRVMALWGGGVPWWRVIHADGSPPPCHERAAVSKYREEGTPMRPGAAGVPSRVDMRRARWDGGAADAAVPAGSSGADQHDACRD